MSLAVPGILTAVVVITWAVLRAEGLDSGHKIAGVAVAIQALTILGLAFLLTGAKNHASNSKDNAEQSVDAGDAGSGA
jgi:hypothetical protein